LALAGAGAVMLFGAAAASVGRHGPAGNPDSWSAQTPYPILISQEALTYQGGRLYSFGGVSQGRRVPTAYKYDPATNQWAALPPLPQALSGASAVSDGTAIYILNGFNGHADQNLLYRYDPLTGAYTTLARPAVATSAQAAVYLAGQIYRIGGALNGTPTGTVEVYTVATDSWAPAPAYPQAVRWLAATAANGAIYTAGGVGAGNQGTAATYRYTPATGVWDDSAVPDLPGTRWGAAAGLVNGRWLLAGGIENGTYSTSMITWDFAGPAWAEDPAHPLPQARYSMGSAAGNLSFYSVGGCAQGDCGTGTSDTQQYQAPAFWDVHPTDYFYTPVLYLVAHGVVSGYADGTFRPSATTTRGQLTKLIVLGEGWPTDTSGGPHFTDVPPSYVFYNVIETAVHHGVISGYSDGTFRPGADVTRGQIAKIIVNAQGWPIDTRGGPHFGDVPPDSTFYSFVETAVTRGIISGYADHTFRPGNPATRGQIAKIVYNALLIGPSVTGTPATRTPTARPTNTSTPQPTSTRTPTPAITATPTPTCAPSWQIVPSPNLGVSSTLSGIAALAPYDVWAVGSYHNGTIDQTLIEHWDGATWSVVASPYTGTGSAYLNGVAAVAAGDVWAVGYIFDPTTGQSPLVEHWNGSTWTIVSTPPVGQAAALADLTVIAANNVWAVGHYYTAASIEQTLTEHWDGVNWTVIPSANSDVAENNLSGISAVAANDIWAVGSIQNTLVEHWDGGAWTIVPSPNVGTLQTALKSVTAVSRDDVWAVGYYFDNTDPGRTLIEHWNGIQWLIVSSPDAGEDFLTDVVAVGPHDVWAVGNSNSVNTLVLRWNGTSWSIIPSPSVAGSFTDLNSIAAVNAGDLWAAGEGNAQTLIEHYGCPAFGR
jgi:hypothetical protein